MSLPEPKLGLVFRYDYLWSRKAKTGRQTSKDRPACIAVATDTTIDPRIVVILPITHSKPSGTVTGIEIPPEVRRTLGLDDEPCWVIVSEYNIDEWPNAGVAPLPGNKRRFSYGSLPPNLFETVLVQFLKVHDGRNAVKR